MDIKQQTENINKILKLDDIWQECPWKWGYDLEICGESLRICHIDQSSAKAVYVQTCNLVINVYADVLVPNSTRPKATTAHIIFFTAFLPMNNGTHFFLTSKLQSKLLTRSPKNCAVLQWLTLCIMIHMETNDIVSYYSSISNTIFKICITLIE